MPELPEVEVTRRGVSPYLEGQTVTDVVMRHSGLRWPFPANLAQLLCGHNIYKTNRRGKYLLIEFEHGTLIVHLGMSGHLRILEQSAQPKKHDHFDLVVGDKLMRMTDPRRFGAVLWHDNEKGPLYEHVLLKGLGVEPLHNNCLAITLLDKTRKRSSAIKQVLLAGDIVVGVGNIYASESLFKARIHPKTPANRISANRYIRLAQSIQETLQEAIELGGSTLRDFVGSDGQSGYFQLSYFVYDRAGQPCRICNTEIRQIKQGQRSTFYCANCQK